MNFKIYGALLLLASLGMPLQASAVYSDGTYRCKNRVGLPENIYVIRSLSVDGTKIPYVEATRYFRKDPTKPDSPIEEARIKGIASVSELNKNSMLMVAAIKLEFENGKLLGCE